MWTTISILSFELLLVHSQLVCRPWPNSCSQGAHLLKVMGHPRNSALGNSWCGFFGVENICREISCSRLTWGSALRSFGCLQRWLLPLPLPGLKGRVSACAFHLLISSPLPLSLSLSLPRRTRSRRQPKLPNTRCGWPPTRSYGAVRA